MLSPYFLLNAAPSACAPCGPSVEGASSSSAPSFFAFASRSSIDAAAAARSQQKSNAAANRNGRRFIVGYWRLLDLRPGVFQDVKPALDPVGHIDEAVGVDVEVVEHRRLLPLGRRRN